ncbi:MAG: flagellin [Vampirovibrionales bacterium]|nr:flagellin [Vampirovibrionales bacterium]
MDSVFNTDPNVIYALANLRLHTQSLAQSQSRIASGKRINSAADDPTGLSLSLGLGSQLRKQTTALQNAQDAISLLQITDGALASIGNNLQRIRELTIQMANDTNAQNQRNVMAQEVRTLAEDINRLSQATQFNGITLLDGSATGVLVQIGPSSAAAVNTVDLTNALSGTVVDGNATGGGLGLINSSGTGATFDSLNDIYDPATGLSSGLNTTDAARNFLFDVDRAFDNLNAQRALTGNLQTQLEATVENITLSNVNLAASKSRIEDLDIAAESSRMVQAQILQQAAVTILGQTSQSQQLINALLNNSG